jgi:multidrug resistance efflux pump
MPEQNSIPVGTILDTWSNDAWTNDVQSVQVKILLDPSENQDHLLRMDMSFEPRVRVR